MVTNYIRGYTKELEAVNEFRKQHFISYRSAGSHSVVDITVFFPKTVLIAQLKRVKKKGNAFHKEIEDFKKQTKYITNPTVIKEFWIYRDYEKRGKKWEKISIK